MQSAGRLHTVRVRKVVLVDKHQFVNVPTGTMRCKVIITPAMRVIIIRSPGVIPPYSLIGVTNFITTVTSTRIISPPL